MPKAHISKLAAAVRSAMRATPPTIDDLGLAAVAAASLWAGTAKAQDPVAAQSDAEEITVTGSRLRRDGMSTPTPVTALDIGEMRQMAPTLLMDSLDQLPQFRDNDAVAVRQHLRQRRRLERREPARHRLESHAGVAQRPAARARPDGRHRRRRNSADGVDPARRGRDRRRFGRLRLGRHQRRHELHPRHRVRGRQSQPANRHDGPARPPALSSRVRGRHRRSASAATSSAPSTTTTPTASWATKAATGAPTAGRCSRNRLAPRRPRRFYAPDGRSRVITSGGLIPRRSPELAPRGITQFIDGEPVPLGTARRSSARRRSAAAAPDLNQQWAATTSGRQAAQRVPPLQARLCGRQDGLHPAHARRAREHVAALADGHGAGLGHDDLQAKIRTSRRRSRQRMDDAGRRSRASRSTACSRTSRRRG